MFGIMLDVIGKAYGVGENSLALQPTTQTNEQSIFQQARQANNTATAEGGPALSNGDGNTKDKFAGAVGKVKEFLTKTGRTDLLNALGKKDLKVESEDLPKNYLGSAQGNLITINSDVLKGASEEKIASILLHELNHVARASKKDTIAEEFQCKQMEEQLLDSAGQGEYANDEKLLSTVKRLYSHLA